MTKEQFIIYIYGIYPGGGLSILVSALFIFYFGVKTLFCIDHKAHREEGKTYSEYMKPVKVASFFLAIILTVGYIIPSKNTFLAIVATPSLVKSLEDKEVDILPTNEFGGFLLRL